MSTAPPVQKTFADYAAVAICPVLIMLIVGSLIYFLLAVGYAGSHLGQLRWTFSWFVLAMVLVSRIAIEKGTEYAWIYGVCLAAATAFMLMQYVAVSFWMWGLLGLIWWASNKLTWDCTVIDEDQDASGEGLLQVARLDLHDVPTGTAPPATASSAADIHGKEAPAKPRARWWEQGSARGPQAARTPHAPGIWVIYFALGSLLIFGLGQGLVAKEDAERRQYVFCLLLTNLAATLALLLITSFLGLRRYLRQRHLPMPPAMAATWLSTGTVLGLAVLILCLLLPRPSAYWSLTAMIDRLGDTASKHAKAAPPQSQRTLITGARNDYAPGRVDQKRLRGETEPQEGAQKANEASGAARVTARTSPSALKWVLYAALLASASALIIRNRRMIWRLVQDFWQALREFCRGLFARKAQEAQPAPTLVATPQRHPFAAIINPFTSGEALQMPFEELVVQSFRGLEAWAEEHNCGRNTDQTPFEFADRVAAEAPDLAHEAQQTARLYVQVAYAKTAVLPPSRTVLEILWAKMGQSA